MNRKYLRRLVAAGATLILVAVAMGLAGKYWLVSLVLRQQMVEIMRARCDGELIIGAVNVNWTGPSYLRDVELRDAAGRDWMRAESVKLTLRNWPGLHPVLYGADVEDLDVRGYFESGTLQLPLKPTPPQKAGNEDADLLIVTVRNMSIAITADKETSSTIWDGLELLVRRERQIYHIELKQMMTESGEELFLNGTVNGGSLESDLNVILKHAVAQKEASAILAALNAPFVTEANGKINAELNFRGRLFDFPSLSDMRTSGAIALADTSVSCARGPLMKNLGGEIRFDGQAPTSAVGEWAASFCQGQVNGNLNADTIRDGTVKYRYKVDASDVNFGEMSRLLSASRETRQGVLRCVYVLNGRTGGSQSSVGQGYVYLEDAHLADIPLLPSLFQYIGLTQFEDFQSTNVEAAFDFKGAVVTLRTMRAANSIAAIDVEPGGQIDIDKHYLDLHVIVAPVKQLHDLLVSIPLVELVVRLENTLTRVRIRGDWDADATSLISKQPLKDIAEGTIEFLRGIVSSGGSLYGTLYNEIDKRFSP